MTDTPSPNAGFTISHRKFGRSGSVAVTIKIAGGAAFTDRVAVTDAAKREQCVEALVARFPGLPREDFSAELDRIAEEVAAADDGGGSPDEPSHATLLVGLIASDPGIELFHTPGGIDSVGYARIIIDGHAECWSIRSKGFRNWISQRFFEEYETVPSGQALSDASNVLAGKAIYQGPEHPVYVRFARHQGAIWVDLADERWRTVRVTPSGWEIVSEDIPVRFVRKRGMLALPDPQRGGSLTLLRSVVNLPEHDAWVLAASWLVASVRPGRPFALLNVNGEQGSAKTTLCKMLRASVDPTVALLRRPPQSDRDLMIAAQNSGMVAFDNLSGLSAGLSDSLCSLATGAGFSCRELYTDDDEKMIDAQRPILINGIDDSVTRPDLLDRSVNIHLPRISKDKRRDEETLWAEFYRLRPLILGAVLTAVAEGLKNLPTTKPDELPRMADFAVFIMACEPALPWAAGEFMKAYSANAEIAVGIAVEASPIAGPILALLDDKRTWEGTAGALLSELNDRLDKGGARRPKGWPENNKAMGNDLRRLAPTLRSLGVVVDLPQKPTGRHKRRILRLERPPKPRSASSAWSADPSPESTDPVWGDPDADHPAPDADHAGAERSTDLGSGTRPANPETPVADRADHADRPPGDNPHGDESWGSL